MGVYSAPHKAGIKDWRLGRDCRTEEREMKKLVTKKRLIKFKHRIDNQIDCHDWATKMEIHRLISGKPDIKVVPKTVSGAVN
jgi:hypothetical protein